MESAISIDSDRQPVTTTDHNSDLIADSHDPPQHSIETDSCNPMIMEDNKREWMGIEVISRMARLVTTYKRWPRDALRNPVQLVQKTMLWMPRTIPDCCG